MNQPLYYFGREGRIIQGQRRGWTVEIVDDTQGPTNGYFFVVSKGSLATSEILDWVQEKENIPFFMDDMGWIIEWPEDPVTK